MRIPLLLSIILSMLFAGVGILKSYRQLGVINLPYSLQIAALAVVSGFALGLGAFPSLWFIFQYVSGRSFEESLFPGQSPDILVGQMFLGIMSFSGLTIWALWQVISRKE